MKPPTSQKEVCTFIAVVKYYHNMWARHSHTLVPLTNIATSKYKFKLTKTYQDAFEEIRLILDYDTLLFYPNFNEKF